MDRFCDLPFYMVLIIWTIFMRECLRSLLHYRLFSLALLNACSLARALTHTSIDICIYFIIPHLTLTLVIFFGLFWLYIRLSTSNDKYFDDTCSHNFGCDYIVLFLHFRWVWCFVLLSVNLKFLGAKQLYAFTNCMIAFSLKGPEQFNATIIIIK